MFIIKYLISKFLPKKNNKVNDIENNYDDVDN